MQEKTYETPLGSIHYWVSIADPGKATLVLLPGLTADHRLFRKQIEYFNGKYNLLVYAPGNVLSTTFLYTKADSNAELSLSFPDGWHSATLIYLAEYDEFHLWNDQGGKIVLERE